MSKVKMMTLTKGLDLAVQFMVMEYELRKWDD